MQWIQWPQNCRWEGRPDLDYCQSVWAVALSPAFSPGPRWLLELRKPMALGNLAKGSGARQEEGVKSEWSTLLGGLRKTCPSLASVPSSEQTWDPEIP